MYNDEELSNIMNIPSEILKELPKRHILGGGKNSIVYLNGYIGGSISSSGSSGSISSRCEETVIKKYYNNKDGVIQSSEIQSKIQKLLCEYPVRVPDIYYIDNRKSIICMEYIETHPNFYTNLLHIIFGYPSEHLDVLWYVPNTYIPKGFYASTDTINSLAKTNNWNLTTNSSIAFMMGSVLRRLVNEQIIPYGVEWTLDKNGRIWLIDFDECEEGYIDPYNFFYSNDSNFNIYIPKCTSELFSSFYNGYFGNRIELIKNIDELYFNDVKNPSDFNEQLNDDELDLKIESCIEKLCLTANKNMMTDYIDGTKRK